MWFLSAVYIQETLMCGVHCSFHIVMDFKREFHVYGAHAVNNLPRQMTTDTVLL